MGGATLSVRLIRRVAPVLVAATTFAALVAAVPAEANVSPSPAGQSEQAPSYRLSIEPASPAGLAAGEYAFTAVLDASDDAGYEPAAGETITFAFVGEGHVVAITDGALGDLSCTTSAAGQCTVTVASGDPAGSGLTAVAHGLSASITLQP